MSNSNNRGQRPTNNSSNYVPPLKSGNPVKGSKADWWEEMCEKHEAVNHWPTREAKEKEAREKEEEKDSDSKNN
jgi:hypothetical protein|tara:strand:+ start:660 stop:881 length:222 start_codon:yes stop_codon:yes gene_type:complete